MVGERVLCKQTRKRKGKRWRRARGRTWWQQGLLYRSRTVPHDSMRWGGMRFGCCFFAGRGVLCGGRSLWGGLAVCAGCALCGRRALCAGRRPGVVPAGEALFFVSPKKSTPKKGDPTGCVPSLRCGQPAVLAPSGVLLKLAFGSDSRKPLSAGRCAPRRSQTGGRVNSQTAKNLNSQQPAASA